MTDNRNNGEISFEITEHIGVIGKYSNREEPWTKEVNMVAWNGKPAKIDIRDWSPDHKRMSRGITLTEDQAMEMTKVLVQRYRARAERSANYPGRDDMAR